MYKAMVIDAGLEPTEENLQSATEIRDSLFLLQNFPKIRESIVKQAQVDLQKKLDEALNNTTKPNTATASDDNANREDLPGPSLSQAFTSGKL
jgi:hypothetical protein